MMALILHRYLTLLQRKTFKNGICHNVHVVLDDAHGL